MNVKDNNNKIIRKNEKGEIVHELFEGASDIAAIPLEEYLKLGISTGWHFDSLEEELVDFISDRDRRIMEDRATEEDYKINIKIGDIIMIYEEDKCYKFLIVQDIKKEPGKADKYGGYELQTAEGHPEKKANIFHKDKDQYANHIWIGDFFSILDKGPRTSKNECYIDVGHEYWFDASEANNEGYWKGTTSCEFMNFIRKCINNARNGDIEANKRMQWAVKDRK